MDEHNSTTMAETCRPTCKLAESRSEKRPNSKISLEPCGEYDGQRLENPAQPTACQGKRQGSGTPDMEGICLPRSRHPVMQEKPCQSEQLETLGNTSKDCRKPIHPEGKAELVNTAKPTGSVNTENVMRLLEYQQYRCALTGRKLTPQTAALDHIVPIQRDGKHTIDNTQVLHKDVNRAKGSLTNREFIQLCHEIVLWPKIASANEESK